MKTCPYCAEEIKDAAIKCRWCGSWLVDEIPATAVGPPRRAEAEEPKAEEETVGAEKEVTAEAMAPVPEREPEAAPGAAASTAAGAATAEPTPAATAEPTPAATAEPTPAAVAPAAQPPVAEAKIEFTHTGTRYLLGYGPDHFGIWDRNSPQQPMEKFPRSDEGWAAAWARYSQIESNWMDLRTGQRST